MAVSDPECREYKWKNKFPVSAGGEASHVTCRQPERGTAFGMGIRPAEHHQREKQTYRGFDFHEALVRVSRREWTETRAGRRQGGGGQSRKHQ